MASLVGLARRNWQRTRPTAVEKKDSPLRFGILGAANIAPSALFVPAKTHPDVVIHAVAARDKAKATTYAKENGIPNVCASYQELIDDPEIDCVYVPLPNGLHYEWALKALKAGKHVLLEKPGVSNTAEAEKLFKHPILAEPNAPVLLEATHSWFHPAFAVFKSYITPGEIEEVKTAMWAPSLAFGYDDVRFQYNLSGGALMDLGPYGLGIIRLAFEAEPEECEKAEVKTVPGRADVDESFSARFRFPNGGVGIATANLQTPIYQNLRPDLELKHRPVVVTAEEAGTTLAEGQEAVRIRKINFKNYAIPTIIHSINIEDEFIIRNSAKPDLVAKRWKKNKTEKVYTFKEAGIDQPGEPYWATYRYCLEQFVDKIRGREPKQWFSAEDSIGCARMIDMAYKAAGLPLRPSSEYEG